MACVINAGHAQKCVQVTALILLCMAVSLAIGAIHIFEMPAVIFGKEGGRPASCFHSFPLHLPTSGVTQDT